MVKKHLLYATICIGGVALLSSCIDDKYDLDNVDTTFGVKLDNLVVPVNMSTIKLDKLLDVDDDSLIEKFPENASPENQYYAIRKSGSFNADPVYVDFLEAKDNATINPFTLPLVNSSVESAFTAYSYLINNVDPSLIFLSELVLDEKKPMEINLQVTTPTGAPVAVKDLVISLPASFEAYYEDKLIENNQLEISSLPDGSLKSPIVVKRLNYKNNPLTPQYNTLDISGNDLGIRSARIENTSITEITVGFTMSGFVANEVSGFINYEIDAPAIDPISLNDLPDFLKDGDSNIILANPQIYLNFENPIGTYYNFDLNITPYGNNGDPIYEQLTPFMTTFVLAGDTKNLALESNYPGLVKQESKSLQKILAGTGLPEEIDFSLSNTYINGEMNNFMLGRDYTVGGLYDFFTPLAFTEDSRIRYQKTEKDFFGDDLTQVNVEYLQLSAYPVSNFPFDITLDVYPLDINGEHILDQAGKEVHASGVVKAYAQGNEMLDITFNQPFTGLDGVEFSVVIDNLDNVTLNPEQNITLNDIRAKVTGEYLSIDDKYKDDYK